ncbi:MAG: hypothetical protein AUH14_11375 [Candidatus Rokubacteria bacterium 13_2_20CM_69_15_1]|nr:MAG: hypothetical protein AUH14_11375 [Candidatus Rokubacteria bacterium 13_2_20CM_69_15_1]
MKSIYQRVLGADFERLHPRIQQRFALTSTVGRAAIGRGVMDKVWRGRLYTLPFLYVGTWRNIMFPERGHDVPFEIENWAYRDSLGRETVTWLRTFHTDRPRRFDAYMIYSEARGRVVDYLGTHQHLAVDLTLSVDERGGLRLRSGEQRFYEGRIAFREVAVSNRVWGPLFGYRGSFDVEWIEAPDGPPTSIRPKREERRE